VADSEEFPPAHLQHDATLSLGPGSTEPTSQPFTLARYRIVGKLGEGGMGVVYEAEQESPRRRVALKVIRGGRLLDDAAVRMFQREVETLARLEHPNIGAIYDSGRTDDGQHYFAMELVRGKTLGEHLALRDSARALSVEDVRTRLELLACLADAVHYAHQRGVIHRDLKPSNVIVTDPRSGAGSDRARLPTIKILDFGLARITDSDVAASMVSEVGAIKGTLNYMSPEQAMGNPAEIDVRTDVYSLGVVLYEMLTGKLPIEIPTGSLMQAVRLITNEPPRPIRDVFRGAKRLDPDVETICSKALEKRPADRYASAAALADDIRRYLASEPIVARPPSTAYQLRKFAQRNKPIVLGTTATLAALVLGVIISTSLAIREGAHRRAAEIARRDAERESERATQVQKFLQEMITSADPSMSKGPLITMGEVLKSAAKKIETGFEDRPDVRGALRFSIGATYAAFSQWDDARTHLEPALAALRESYPGDHEQVAECLRMLGEAYEANFEPAAIPILKECVEMNSRLFGEEHLKTATAIHDLAYAHYGVSRRREIAANSATKDSLLAVAEQLYLRSQKTFLAEYGDADPNFARCLHALSPTLWAQGRREEARELLDRAIRIVENADGDNRWFLESLYDDRSALARNSGEYEDAVTMATKALETRRAVYGVGSLQEGWSIRTLGRLARLQNRPRDAIEQLEAANAIFKTHLHEHADDRIAVLEEIAEALAAVGDAARGLRVGGEVVASRRAVAERNPDDADAQHRAARALLDTWPSHVQDPAAAERFARRACELTTWTRPDVILTLGLAQRRLGRSQEAAATAERAKPLIPPDDQDLLTILRELSS